MGVLVVVEMPLRSGLARDKVVNTFAIAEAEPGSTNGNAGAEEGIHEAIVNLYTTPHADLGGFSLSARMGAQLSRAADACQVKLYDLTGHLDGSPHGSPFFIAPMTLAAADNAQGLPEEVAYCVTLEAQNRGLQRVEVPDGADPDAKPDRPRQRYTGRVYVGPLSSSVNAQDGSGMTRPSALLQTGSRSVFSRFVSEVDTDSGGLLSVGVWSRKNHAIRGVDTIRTDDAFDTQRRRGASPIAVSRLAVAGIGVPQIELAA